MANFMISAEASGLYQEKTESPLKETNISAEGLLQIESPHPSVRKFDSEQAFFMAYVSVHAGIITPACCTGYIPIEQFCGPVYIVAG